MDSVTQAALGASIAHLCWHKNMGKKSFLYGALLGTLPDLDIVIYPLLNGVQRLYWHRGESHSIFFIIFASLLASLIFRKKAGKFNLSQTRFFTGLFLIFLTHIIIDLFTVYGTQLFAPILRYGFGRGNFFIIDPLYTFPLLAGIIIAFFVKEKKCFRANVSGLVISTFYALFSLCSHGYADHVFKKDLELKNIKVISSITSATPMNTILWRHIARTDKGLLIGYFSIIGNGSGDGIEFDFVKRNEELIKGMENQPNVNVIKWFSKGFWVAEKKGEILTMSDLRFGELRPHENSPSDKWEYIFTWELNHDPNDLTHKKERKINMKGVISQLWKRIKGF